MTRLKFTLSKRYALCTTNARPIGTSVTNHLWTCVDALITALDLWTVATLEYTSAVVTADRIVLHMITLTRALNVRWCHC